MHHLASPCISPAGDKAMFLPLFNCLTADCLSVQLQQNHLTPMTTEHVPSHGTFIMMCDRETVPERTKRMTMKQTKTQKKPGKGGGDEGVAHETAKDIKASTEKKKQSQDPWTAEEEGNVREMDNFPSPHLLMLLNRHSCTVTVTLNEHRTKP